MLIAPRRTVSTAMDSAALQKTLRSILGCALLLYGSSGLAFTLITFPQEQLTPSSSVTEATTYATQIQPIIGAVWMQVRGRLRGQSAPQVSQFGRMVAASAPAEVLRDFNPLAGSLAAASGSGSGGAGGGSEVTDGLWISTTYNSIENDFYRTAFYGDTQNITAGLDFTRSDRFVLGFAAGYEARNYITSFNLGGERTRGYNITPYFAYLLSDTWSLDLSLGYADLDTRQSRTLATINVIPVPVAVSSEFSATREFAAANLTNVSASGNWRLTSSLGLLAARLKQEAYVESNGAAVVSTNQKFEQWSLLGEAAYGRGEAEAFFGLMYEDANDPPRIQFATGEQPANDTDSVLVTAGWRHLGRRYSASFVFSSRVALEQVTEHGFSMMLRVDL